VADPIKVSTPEAIAALHDLGLKVALIPVAAGALYPAFGILLSPVFAAGAMAFSSVFVLGNTLRLKRFAAPMTGETAARHPAPAPVAVPAE
jgi:cation transport ATPase